MADEERERAQLATEVATPQTVSEADQQDAATEADAAAQSLLLAGQVFSHTDRDRQPTETEIRARAHEIYLSRGASSGDEVSDWLEAERELRLERALGEPGNGSIAQS